MLKQLALTLAITAALPAWALNAGELAFTSFNADEDGFAMVALVDLAANTQVYFSDNEWDGTAFNSGESHSSWTTGSSTIGAGTVVRFSAVDHATNLATSLGSFTRETVSGSANWGLSQAADTVYAYLGSSATAPTLFLAAISSGTFGTGADGSLANTGLAIGAGAVQLSNSADYAEYSGPRSGQSSFAGYKALVSNTALWTDSGNGSYATSVPDTTPFNATAVPELQTYLLMLAGLAAMGLRAARRRA